MDPFKMDSSIIVKREVASPAMLRESGLLRSEPAPLFQAIRLFLTTDNPQRKLMVSCFGNDTISTIDILPGY